MLDQLLSILPYVLPAALVGLLGGLVPAMRAPSEAARAHIEHLAAGVLLAVIAFSVSVEIRHIDELGATAAGLLAGAGCMVAMKSYLRRYETPRDDPSPTGFIAAALIDTLIDGMLVGAAFAVRPELAVLVLVGLTIELFVLNMSVGAELRALRMNRARIAVIAAAIPAALAVGAALGVVVISGAGPQVQAGALAFAVAALLYLVAEELLLRGNDIKNSPRTTTSFFAGFVLIAIFTMWSEGV